MIVLDASVLAAIVGDDGDDGAMARTALAEAGEASIPDLADIETLSVLRRFHLAGGLSATRFRHAVNDLSVLPLTRYSALPLLGRASKLIHHVSAYDAIYVSLAEVLDVDLLTADARLARTHRLPCRVRLLKDS
ncbi:MAG: type II toxin-antitoxin system VapC family toxin [Acidimicrobiales bacterium]